jgi:hypothetical protein
MANRPGRALATPRNIDQSGTHAYGYDALDRLTVRDIHRHAG